MSRRLTFIPLAMVLTCLQATALMAANPDTGPGCGLGKVAWADYEHQKHIAPQVLMSTTNNTILPWQMFGISTGTSGCTNDGVIVQNKSVNMFASITFENLSQEMAQGHGEHLASLATLMNVPAEYQAEFFAMTQDKYASLIRAGETTPVALVTALHDAMAAHPVLAKLSTNR